MSLEDNKKFYKIDSLKLKQKIYSSYPANSAKRRQIVKDEKVKQLIDLGFMQQSLPMQISSGIRDMSLRQAKRSFIKGLITFVIASSLIAFYRFIPDGALIGAIIVIGAYFMTNCVYTIFIALSSVYLFDRTQYDLSSKINKLKKDLLQ